MARDLTPPFARPSRQAPPPCVPQLFKIFALACLISLWSGTAAAQWPKGLLYYAHEDGQVRGVDMWNNGDAGVSIPATSFFGTPPTPPSSRNISFDLVTRLMWYSASDNNIHSLNVDTLAPGPTISDLNDAFYGAIRAITVDPLTRRLYASLSSGDVAVFELVTNIRIQTIPLISWGISEPNPGNLRHLATDKDGMLWYAAADGTFKQFDPSPSALSYTGLEIPSSEQVGTIPGQNRSMLGVSWVGGYPNYLYYAASDGSVRGIDLATRTAMAKFWDDTNFWGATNPGVLRAITVDPNWTAPLEVPASPSGVTASDGTFTDRIRISWNPVPGADDYEVFRQNPGEEWWWIVISGITEPTWDEVNWQLTPGTIYTYTATACNDDGCSGEPFSMDTGFMASGLTPPTNVAASQGSSTEWIRVTWTAVVGATSYTVSTRLLGTDPWTVLTTTTNTLVDDSAPDPGVRQEYKLSACASTCSADSAVVFGWKSCGSYPTAPSGVSASNGSYSDRVRISWDSVAEAVSYGVIKLPTLGGLPLDAGTTTETWIDDLSIAQNEAWTYSVSASTASCSSDLSEEDVGWAGSSLVFTDGFEYGSTSRWGSPAR